LTFSGHTVIREVIKMKKTKNLRLFQLPQKQKRMERSPVRH